MFIFILKDTICFVNLNILLPLLFLLQKLTYFGCTKTEM